MSKSGFKLGLVFLLGVFCVYIVLFVMFVHVFDDVLTICCPCF